MKKYLFLFIVPAFVLASGGHDGVKDYDVLWRSINFILFFGILFYLLKGPAKAAYQGRIDGIASRLEANQKILKESAARKEQAKKDLQDAKVQGAALIETAKKEIVFAAEKIKNATEQEIANLQKSFDEQKSFEARKIKKEVVSEILDDVFASDDIKFGQDKLVKIVEKKVG